MTEMSQVYKCNICGNIVEVLHTGKGILVCCGKPMDLLTERTSEDQYKEKHVPVVSAENGQTKVTVGSVRHPMTAEHYIEWVEVLKDGSVCRKALAPENAPEAEFPAVAEPGTVRAYCNLHGLWKAEKT